MQWTIKVNESSLNKEQNKQTKSGEVQTGIDYTIKRTFTDFKWLLQVDNEVFSN